MSAAARTGPAFPATDAGSNRWQRLGHAALVLAAFTLLVAAMPSAAAAPSLPAQFADPPPSAWPGVYWYFMDGNLSREGMTRDLEAMRAAGLGHVVFLEVNVGVPRGPVDFLSERWQELFVHAVREAERLGIEITLGSGPGWTGSGGPWVKPEQSMQHLVAAQVVVQGPARFDQVLPVPPPRRPFFGDLPKAMRSAWEDFYRDVAVLAFPTPTAAGAIPDADEKALVYRAPFSSQPGVKPRIESPAEFPPDAAGSAIPLKQVVDLTRHLRPDGTLDWEIPAGRWTVMRFVARNNGASTRPAPEPGLGFECDKFDRAALDAHFAKYGEQLLNKVGPRKPGAGWTMLHMDSWEMGAQNWSPRWREEFRRRRGYDPLPFYPAFAGAVVGSRELSERFLWDLRVTGQELVIENHAERLKELGRRHGLQLSIEPYDMTPVNDFDLGAVADVPMCEFWSIGFNTAFSCQEASSIAHIYGRPVVAAEAFTGAPGEDWKLFPGSLKNQGDWAFGLGVNRLTIHTFAHKPDETRPGMVMGPYGVHWDRGQTWWPMAGAYHRYLSRCQTLLREGRTVADILYLIPEGAPTVFQPPASASSGDARLPDRRGYNFDGCSALTLIRLAKVRDGRIVFPSGASYRLLVLPDVPTMTPALIEKLSSLVKAGATIVGKPPRKSPSLENYPGCDAVVARQAAQLWPGGTAEGGAMIHRFGKGRVFQPQTGVPAQLELPSAIMEAQWIWFPKGAPAESAEVGKVWLGREFTIPAGKEIRRASLEMTADNSFSANLNGKPAGQGDNFHEVVRTDVTGLLRSGTNVLTVRAENAGSAANPAGLLGALHLEFSDGSRQVIATDAQWAAALNGGITGTVPTAKVLGAAGMSPWNLHPAQTVPPLYPDYGTVAEMLRRDGVPEDFASSGPLRYTHRTAPDREIYFVANRSGNATETSAIFRVADGQPELWDPLTGVVRALPQNERANGLTTIPLRFEAYGSCFVVFPRTAKAAAAPANGGANFSEPMQVATLEGPWLVAFDPERGAPASVRFETLADWTRRPEAGLRHYSGIATYRKSFDLPPDVAGAKPKPLYLDLGEVQVMARVRVNGQDCGVAWTAPWRVDISKAMRAVDNVVAIEVANLWPNRMIGDAASSGPGYAKTTYRPFKAGDALLPSGLLGPVRLLR